MIRVLLNNAFVDQSNIAIQDQQILERAASGQANRFESYENLNLISFDWLDIHNQGKGLERITIYHSIKEVIFFCEGERSKTLVQSLLKSEEDYEKMLYFFFSELIKEDIVYIEDFEEKITNLEDELINNTQKGCAKEITAFRRELLRLKRYYEQLNQIFEGLSDNDNKLLRPEYRRYFQLLNHKIDRLFSHVLTLRDYVTQVREAYQAQIDIEQNSLMKIFTVVTTIFAPLTLIVGWYGMNVRMPEVEWKYGYIWVIILNAAVLLGNTIYFKIKKWL